MQVVGERRVHHALMICWRHDDRAEIGPLVRPMRGGQVGVALILGAQTKSFPRVPQRLWVDVYGGDHLDQPVLDVRPEGSAAPRPAATARPDVYRGDRPIVAAPLLDRKLNLVARGHME